MSEEQYEDHQARVHNLSGGQIVRELEKAVRWSQDTHPDLAHAGKAAIQQVGNLLSMDSINRHQAIELNGERYDSKGEARRHNILMMREHAGAIERLKHHPERIPLVINGVEVATWQPDFEYFEAGIRVLEDFKGFTSRRGKKKDKHGRPTYQVNPAWRAFKFKAKIIKALFPDVEVRVVTLDRIAV